MNDPPPAKPPAQRPKVARVVLGLVILAAIFWVVDLGTFIATLGSLSPFYLALLLSTAALGRMLRAWKWNLLLRARGVSISNWQALRLSFVSHFAGAWTPGQIGGDAYRMFALRDFNKSDVVLSTLIIERYAGMCAVSLCAIVGLPWSLPFLQQRAPWVVWLLLALILAIVVVIPSMFSRRILGLVLDWVPLIRGTSVESKLRSFYRTIVEYRNHKCVLLAFSLSALVEVISYFVLNYLSARAVGLDVSLLYFLLAMPIVHLFLRIPISFQALGIQESCFAYAFVLHGFQPAQGLAVSVVQRTLEWVVSIAPGGFLLWCTSGPSPYDLRDDLPDASMYPRR